MPIHPMFDNVLFSSDGGEEVVDLVATVQDIYDLHTTGRIEIRNARPMHRQTLTKAGKVKEYAGSDSRLRNWIEQLNYNKGVLGTLSWNCDPDTTEFELDRKTARFTLKAGKIATPDSATRHRAIIEAVQAKPRTIDMNRKVSIRVWFVPQQRKDQVSDERLTFEQVFDSYNQDGKPVNASVAKFNYQRDEVDKLVRAIFGASPHLGLDNVETVQNSISPSSSKLVAYNTLNTAFVENFTIDLETQEDMDRELAWLVSAWDELVTVLPAVGKVGKSKAQALRETSLVRSAVVVYGYVGVVCKIRERGLDPAALLPKLPGSVTLSEDGVETRYDEDGLVVPRFRTGETVDFFSYGNPLWQNIGLLVSTKDEASGLVRFQIRNARQTRQGVTEALLARIGIPSTKKP